MHALRERGEAGLSGVAMVVTLGVVLVAVVVSASLLWMTMSTANSINEKAESIRNTGRGINTATDTVVQLTRTNETAQSILSTAEPLEGQLSEVVEIANTIAGQAESIDGTAATIGQSATSIDSTAATINDTAGGINSQAAGILDVAGRINSDVQNINANLDETIGLARNIEDDTSGILTTAESIHFAACNIDSQLLGQASGDGC